MIFIPSNRQCTFRPRPDVHAIGTGVLPEEAHQVWSYNKNHKDFQPNSGRWYELVMQDSDCELSLPVGALVLCNLSYRNHLVSVGADELSVYGETKMIGVLHHDPEERIMNFIPLPNILLTKPNDFKHTQIIARTNKSRLQRIFGDQPVPEMPQGKSMIAPVNALGKGQKTSDDYDDGYPDRENDGVHVLFEEVVASGDGTRFAPGDMIAYKEHACTNIVFLGQAYHGVPCTPGNGVIVGHIPASEFAPELVQEVAS